MKLRKIIKCLCPYGFVRLYQKSKNRDIEKKEPDVKQGSEKITTSVETIIDPSNRIVNEKDEPVLLDKCSITIKGTNNYIQIDSSTQFQGNGRINIIIHGNNNRFILGKNNIIFINLIVVMGSCDLYSIEEALVQIGSGNHIGGVSIELDNSKTSVIIGNNCQFADRIVLYNTDGHPIYNMDGKIINKVNRLSIGNEVWVCQEVLMLKNTSIPSGCIVGRRALVAGKGCFTETNCAIAGNPARVVTRHISWKEYSKEYVENL